MIVSPLRELVTAQKRGESKGIASICSANPLVIEATLRRELAQDRPVLIESTCNQVNQYGGYTGMTPDQFMAYLQRTAEKCHFPVERLIVGGDHLGPNPWQHEPASVAMEKAQTLVGDCVRAGYCKLHLDASMKCADDEPGRPLDKLLSAQRVASLALVAEAAFNNLAEDSVAPTYVIGTEVPLPGGAQGREEKMVVTNVDDVAETIELTRQAFAHRGLESAWERVIAVVVQPGVEFGDSILFQYERRQATALTRFIEKQTHLVYEAHSTDYQSVQALKEMVEDHFAILKVGPALTFALREGIFALAMIEEELFSVQQHAKISHVRRILDEAMLAKPSYWQRYYEGDAQEQMLARKYSFSDRSRYYWPEPGVQSALSRLIDNLEKQAPPWTLLSQYMPEQYERVRSGELVSRPRQLLMDKVSRVLADYDFACHG